MKKIDFKVLMKAIGIFLGITLGLWLIVICLVALIIFSKFLFVGLIGFVVCCLVIFGIYNDLKNPW